MGWTFDKDVDQNSSPSIFHWATRTGGGSAEGKLDIKYREEEQGKNGRQQGRMEEEAEKERSPEWGEG